MSGMKRRQHKNAYQVQEYISKNVRLLRLLNGMSQVEAAEAFNMSRPCYCSLEGGMKMPDFTTVCMVADYYGINLDYLISFDISEHFMSMLTSGTHESKTIQFADRYLMLSHGARQLICRRMEDMISNEEIYNHFPWDYSSCSR